MIKNKNYAEETLDSNYEKSISKHHQPRDNKGK